MTTTFEEMLWVLKRVFKIHIFTRYLENPSTILVYPNPSYDQLNIDFGDVADRVQEVRIQEIGGSIVLKSQTNGAVNQTLNVSQFAPGLYILGVKGSDFYRSHKILIR